MYTVKYKCRLCGEIFDKGKAESKEYIEELKFKKEWSCVWTDHECKDGNIGVADAIGFIKDEK